MNGRNIVKLLVFITVAVLWFSLPAAAQRVEFSAFLNGAQETPPVATNARGTALMSYNVATDLIDLNVFATGISQDRLLASHIHLAPIGVAGPVIFPLGGGSSYTNVNGGIQLILTGAVFPAEFEDELLANGTYVNLHTPQFTAGEIRGQLLVVPEPASILLACSGLAGIAVRRRWAK